MEDGLYHAELGLPRLAGLGVRQLVYSQHAIEAARADRYGRIENLPLKVDLSKGVFECEVKSGKVVKVCIRIVYDTKRDLVLVVSVPSNLVRTVWLNLKTDTHTTLDRNRYKELK